MPAARMPLGLAVVHPFPSALNAVAVLGIALVAGAAFPVAASLALGMLGIQFCIGAVNDLIDEPLDAGTKPGKPIPRGIVSRRSAVAVAGISGAAGLALAASHGFMTFGLAAAMLTAGLAYDIALKRTPWSWAAYSIALPLLPLYAWWGATQGWPPRVDLVVPVAALAGPALQLSNSLVDVDRDRNGGVRSLALILGPRRALAVAFAAVATIHGVAWASLLATFPRPLIIFVALASTLCAATGLVLTASSSERRRERGWKAQGVALALLAVSWLAAAADG